MIMILIKPFLAVLNTDKIAKDLKLKKIGTENGSNNRPATSCKTRDNNL